MNKGIKIKRINLINDNFFGNMEFKFKNNRIDENIFSTVIIGQNGLGKSHLLSRIVDILNDLNYIKDKSNKIDKNDLREYEIEYSINGSYFNIKKGKNGNICIKRDDQEIHNKELVLPNKVLACSFMVNDRFTYEDGNNKYYNYLGIKGTATGVGTKTFIKKIGNNIITASNNEDFLNNMKKTLNFLNMDEFIILSYEVRKYKKFFLGNLDKETFKYYFGEWREWSTRKTEPFSYVQYKELDEHMIDEIIDFINEISRHIDVYNGKKCVNFKLNLNNHRENKNIMSKFKNINILMKLDLLSSPNIIVKKKDEFNLSHGSSGETNLLFTITNILSRITDNSVILIDEPEISLHPSWQIRFIELLKDMLSNYNCHIILATHSHFMVSDLNIDNSSLITLEDNGIDIVPRLYDRSTYGWSVENILLNVFDIPCNRNYYLAKELDEIISKIAVGKISKADINIERLDKIETQLLDKDPLKVILKKILKKVDRND